MFFLEEFCLGGKSLGMIICQENKMQGEFVAGMILYLGEIILGGQCPWNINVWENIVKGESLTIEIWGIHEKGE